MILEMADERVTDYTDPQFMNTLEACLKTEIDRLNNSLIEQNARIRKIQSDLAWKWKEVVNMSERIKDCRANIKFTTGILKSLGIYKFNLESDLDLIRVNLDDGFYVMSSEIKHQQQILQEYEETWKLYEAGYETLPLAKARSEAKANLEKLHIKEMVLDFKHKQVGKRLRQSEWICWLRLRSEIVKFAEVMLENETLMQTLSVQLANVKESNEEFDAVDAELEIEKKEFEDDNKIRSQQILEMPPPKMHLPLYRKNDTKQADSTEIGGQWNNKCKKSSDSESISITGSIYAEILHQEEEVCSSTQGMEPKSPQFEKSDSYAQRPKSHLRRMISREIPMETVDLTEDEEEHELIVVEEGDNRESAEMRHEPEEETNVPVFDFENQPTEIMSARWKKEKSEAERVHPIAELMQIEPAMKRLKMTINRDIEDRNSQDTSCSTVKTYKWGESKDRKTLVPSTSDRSEKNHPPNVLRVRSVENVHFDLFSKFGQQNIETSNTPGVVPISYSPRNHYCESEAISGVEGLANLTDVGSLCVGSFAAFSGCTNLSPPFSMTTEKDAQDSIKGKPDAQANNKKTNFQAFGFGCSSTNNPGLTKFF